MRRRRVIDIVNESAPPHPACFDISSWKVWLVAAHESGLRIFRRADTGKSRGDRHAPYMFLPTNRIPFCDSCAPRHQQAMAAQDRCHPCDPEVLAVPRMVYPTLTDVVELKETTE